MSGQIFSNKKLALKNNIVNPFVKNYFIHDLKFLI